MSGRPGQRGPQEQAEVSIRTFVESLAGAREITPDDAQAAKRKLRNYIVHHMQGISPEDLEDTIGDILLKWFRLARDDKIPSVASDAYFLVIARHVALDRIRKPQLKDRSFGDAELSTLPDDGVAASFDAIATAESIRWALSQALAANDTTACQVVTIALNEIQQSGSVPSHRAIGSQLGISHTAVAKALSRFRLILMEADED